MNAPASPVLLQRHAGWAELVLNRPARRNAIDMALARALGDAIETLAADDSVRAVLLRGADGGFCSGLDLQALQAEAGGLAAFAPVWERVHQGLRQSRKAWVVALERHAINGGAALALAGDLLVCGAGAFLQIGEIRLGMAAPRNAEWLALRHAEAVAARLCLLGDRVPAPELLRLGIATEMVDDTQVLDRARGLAATIGGFPADGVAAIKGGMRAASVARARNA
ncbi:enoyl-CoA hydratase/isomerase family protein [Cupriavidus alkaliphilus]|uniref:Enoyl-CoA hydratase/carnithine racemase n=1 Tax=Cupriavidus alkaliphilus TaxID=942866 RepID=A0A7W4YRI8_9BURK|nr:enoyl-CoA hydratase/isomerase family protein [Cupriavidus alkaliphilus]MBB2917807.1 enoyl-CoA hydratase/carnithine racemase [Cupriavidus alkaliphilus]MBB3007467.1 enoyl-CoA hydratase/carnithine racemase [Cupriavidus alkaliphilus]MBB3013070.1 enoyl-CoA hydratase/carnithine racemase [Cupriavidus alkaliphilus]PVY77703.1 enoyl-CoA hydratase/carnithine racemase [Cupriavidus alkaliphilus]